MHCSAGIKFSDSSVVFSWKNGKYFFDRHFPTKINKGVVKILNLIVDNQANNALAVCQG